MPFWDLHPSSASAALLDRSGCTTSYRELAALSDAIEERLPRYGSRGLGFILFDFGVPFVGAYLACLRGGHHVPLLLSPTMHPSLLFEMAAIYQPDWMVVPPGAGKIPGYDQLWEVQGLHLLAATSLSESKPIHPDLALLLSTSGSTGSSKLVRLSYDALASNAEAISEYLNLNASDRAITTLPLSYSFGMSVLNSHLVTGGSVVLSDQTLLSRDFWDVAVERGITSLSGVPSSFDMLRRAGLERRGLDRLRMITQAGGRLRPALVEYFNALAQSQGWQFFVMYGQTEAAPRISYVPPDKLGEKPGSVGKAIPGGKLDVDPLSGELIYAGPNVMMGYAENRDDLTRPDENRGVLRTGDLAEIDPDGFVTITGRLSRFVKLSGNRVNLDSVEDRLSAVLRIPVLCTGVDDALNLWIQARVSPDIDPCIVLRDFFNIHPSHVRVQRVDTFPLFANGKVDYAALAKCAEISPEGRS